MMRSNITIEEKSTHLYVPLSAMWHQQRQKLWGFLMQTIKNDVRKEIRSIEICVKCTTTSDQASFKAGSKNINEFGRTIMF